MPGGARQLSVAAAVRAPAQVPSPRSRPEWPSAPRRYDPGEVGPPSGVAGARMSGRRPRWSSPLSRRGTSAQPVERTSNVQCPVSRCPLFRCPDGQACAVRGTAAARSASRWTWSGWLWGAAGWAQWVEVPPVSAGGWSPASGLTGSDGAAVGRARRPRGRLSPRADAWPASGCGAAWPPGRHGLVQGQGAGRVGEPGRSRCSPVPRRASGRSPAWCRPWAWTKRW
jgi:hypothetical protein